MVTIAAAAGLAAMLLAAPAAPAAAAAAAEPGASAYREVLATRAPAVVTVRYVLKIELGGTMGGAMGGDGQETEGEISGVVVDPGGLVLCSNTLLGGFANLLGRLMGAGSDFEISATPEDIEVLVGDSTEGLSARLVARDSDLDLAWVQIDEPPAGLAAIDLGAGVPAKIGEPFVAVRRMDKVFARAPALIEGRIGGETTKPRRLWVPAASPFGGHGLPVFNTEGALLGVTVMQFPDAEDTGGAGPMASLVQSARLEEVLSAVILPAREVERATALAREMAAERAAAGEDAAGGEPDGEEGGAESDGGEAEAEPEPGSEPEPGDGDGGEAEAEPEPDSEPEPGDGGASAESASAVSVPAPAAGPAGSAAGPAGSAR
jgi:S1-C subfamily serine protease